MGNQYGRTYLKRSIMMLDFNCVNLAILAFIGLVASEADPQLVYQQPSYIYPGGHPVYRMAGFPHAYPVYEQPAVVPKVVVAQERAGSSIASGPEMGEIIKDFKPAPAFYADCNSEAQSQINEINRIRGFVNKVECEQNLVWLAWKHTKDQIDWESQGGGYDDTCNLHSWNTTPEHRCCYPSDHSNAECMWNAFEEIQGWSIGNVYEVSAVGTNKFKDALKLWSKSGGHNVVIDGTGGWDENTKKGGCWTEGGYTNCIF